MLAGLRRTVHAAAPSLVASRTGIGDRSATAGVALTFDDGPDPQWTPQLLDLLAELDVRATFFLVGRNVKRRPDLVRRIADAGHALGSHTYSHPDPWTMKGRAVVQDVRAGRAAVEDVVGRRVPLFRPPQGHLGLWEVLAVRRLRLTPWLWTLDSGDWKPGTDDVALQASLAPAGAGDVVLLHDALVRAPTAALADRSATLRAVPTLVGRVRGRGLPLVVLPDR